MIHLLANGSWRSDSQSNEVHRRFHWIMASHEESNIANRIPVAPSAEFSLLHVTMTPETLQDDVADLKMALFITRLSLCEKTD